MGKPVVFDGAPDGRCYRGKLVVVRLIVRHLSSKEKVNALAETVTVPKAGHAYNAASAGEDDIDQAGLAYEPAPRHSGLSAA